MQILFSLNLLLFAKLVMLLQKVHFILVIQMVISVNIVLQLRLVALFIVEVGVVGFVHLVPRLLAVRLLLGEWQVDLVVQA